MRWNVGIKIGAGFGMVLAIFSIVGTVTYQSTTRLIAAASARQHTYEVLGRLAEIESLAGDAQNEVRGYVITRAEKHLDVY